ncbi:MAG TPA: 3-hydroxyacyl-ACP dehydratase FabZ family protein [Syntrophales bacterium]|nr:3-hydroxyacyl-ACP dehydratase FabZ family protein [Syntrophales bacterium]
MAADRKTIEDVLAMVPQQPPFRFIDDILELDENRIVGTYRFRDDEYFYRGHFPGYPITPGVILIETMAQTGVVAFGIYQLMEQGVSIEQIKNLLTLFTMIDNCEFRGIVSPGQRVIITGEKIYLRRGNLKTKVSMERENGESVCHAELTGRGVNFDET